MKVRDQGEDGFPWRLVVRLSAEKETQRCSPRKHELWQGRKLVLRRRERERGLTEGDGVVRRVEEGASRRLEGQPDAMEWGDRQDWLFRNVKLSSTLPPTHVVRTFVPRVSSIERSSSFLGYRLVDHFPRVYSTVLRTGG